VPPPHISVVGWQVYQPTIAVLLEALQHICTLLEYTQLLQTQALSSFRAILSHKSQENLPTFCLSTSGMRGRCSVEQKVQLINLQILIQSSYCINRNSQYFKFRFFYMRIVSANFKFWFFTWPIFWGGLKFCIRQINTLLSECQLRMETAHYEAEKVVTQLLIFWKIMKPGGKDPENRGEEKGRQKLSQSHGARTKKTEPLVAAN
jgi:hypothetical protein